MLDSAVSQRARATDFGGTHPSMLDGAAALILAGAGDTSSAHSDDADSTPARRDMARTQEQLQLEVHHNRNIAEHCRTPYQEFFVVLFQGCAFILCALPLELQMLFGKVEVAMKLIATSTLPNNICNSRGRAQRMNAQL